MSNIEPAVQHIKVGVTVAARPAQEKVQAAFHMAVASATAATQFMLLQTSGCDVPFSA